MNYFSRLISIIFLAFSLLIVACKPSQPQQANNKSEKDSTSNDFLVPIEESEKQFSKDIPEPVWKPKKGDYHPTRTKHFDLIHTKLDIRPDWEKQWIFGVATITVEPYFYPQSKIDLDAKALSLEHIKLLRGSTQTPLRWDYDGKLLSVRLDRSYEKGEKITIEIKYIAKPNEALWTNAALTDIEEEGFYFINPTGQTKNKPQQIWTQGQTTNNSMWFPTFDAPNYRGTQEIYITVDDEFETLSNGRLVSTKTNLDSTRTDYWKMDKPHPPYLAMVAVGKFKVEEDSWKNIPLYYYTEPNHQAKPVFANTPKMMEFYSEYLDYPFPWSKYAQVIVRDYTSGAMENTSASVFMEGLLVNERSLKDHSWDGIIAHELFHQWFGNLVTNESWANLPLNESFAEYGEYLWWEHHKGKKEADRFLASERMSYLREAQSKREPMVRYNYTSENDMFDNHSYAKGCVVLNMLRYEVGDKAFQIILQEYLKKHAFSAVELDDLRLVAEEVTGKDLMWFFEQWFLSAGHPELDITKEYQNNLLSITISQTQDTRYSPIYRLPISVDIWSNGKKMRKEIALTQTEQTFEFGLASKPELVVIDPMGYLLAVINEDKSEQELRLQAQKYEHYIPKRNALYRLAEFVDNDTTRSVLIEATKDPYYAFREQAIRSLGEYKGEEQEVVVNILKDMAQNDENNLVRASALDIISTYGEHRELWINSLKDSSYFVLSNAIYSLVNAYGPEALIYVEPLENTRERHITYALAEFYSFFGIPNKYDWMQNQLESTSGTELSYLLNHFTQYLINQSDDVRQKGIEYLTQMAKTNSNFQTRKDAYQSLVILSTSVEDLDISETLSSIRNSEKDRRVTEFQEALGF